MTEQVPHSIAWLVETARRALADVADYGTRDSREEAGWAIHRLRSATADVDPDWPDNVRLALRRCR